MVQVSTRIRPKWSLMLPKMSPPATAPINVHVMSEPALVLVNPRSVEIAVSMKLTINRSNPSMEYPIAEPAKAFQPYAVTLSSGRAIRAVVASTPPRGDINSFSFRLKAKSLDYGYVLADCLES